MARAWLVLALAAGCSGDKGDDTGADHTGTHDTATTPTDTQTDTDTDTTTSTGDVRVATILSLTPDHDAGAEQYQRTCQACHGADGAGTLSGADLTARLPLLTDEEVVSTVLNGKGNMDSFALLKNQQIADVVHYVTMMFR